MGCLLALRFAAPPGLITSRPRRERGGIRRAAPAWAAEGIRAAAFSSRAWAPGLPGEAGAIWPRAPSPRARARGFPRTRRSSAPSPALQGRAHPLPLSAFGALVSESSPVPQPSSAPAAHLALLQISVAQNRTQRAPRRATPAVPTLRRPPRGLHAGTPPLSAPSRPFPGSVKSTPRSPQSREPGPSTVSLHQSSGPRGLATPIPIPPRFPAAAPPPGPSSSLAPPEQPGRERRQLEEKDEVILSLGVSWWRRGSGRRERARGEERNVQVRGAPRRPLLLLLLAAAAARAAAAGPGRRGARAAGRGARWAPRAAWLRAGSQAALLPAPGAPLARPSAQPGGRAGAAAGGGEPRAGREAGARRGGGGRRRQRGKVPHKGGRSSALEASWPLSQTGG